MKKLALATVFALVLGLASGAFAWADGTYSGVGEGFNDDIALDVTVEGGEITDINVTSQDETPDYWEEGQQTIDDIIAAQSTDVDTETGATASSEGIVAAVNDALAGAEAEEPAEDVDEEVEEEELPETGGGVLPLLPGIGGLIAAGGALLAIRRK